MQGRFVIFHQVTGEESEVWGVRPRGRPAFSFEEFYKFRITTLRQERNAITEDAGDKS